MNAKFAARLERAHLIAARVVVQDAAALPIFERLDAELQAARAALTARKLNNPVAYARALVHARKASNRGGAA
ncbi:hypothetical protein [Paracoccus sp. SSJ]|uniref:hypothetical protein n=1 Tax=Paracoccus sp. SSJ TaxID=3050636 RepID=UPI00254B5824|nr:hypothetical protein [Paracoccus sp. SSJ]MDK8871612.1 hypothetical protein [Paracoccus sp. SSJ]